MSVGLQMTGDVRSAEHLSTDATSDFAFVSDHVGSKSVFGGERRGTGLQPKKDDGAIVSYNFWNHHTERRAAD